MSTELLLKDGEAQFSAIKQEAMAVAEECNQIIISDATTLAIAQQRLSLVKEKWNAVEAIRKKLKQPSLDEGKAVDDLAKPLLEPLADALAKGKVKLLKWNESQKKQEVVSPALQTTQPKGVRKTWTFEIINENEIPRGFMTPNIAKIQAYLDAHKDSLKDGDIKAGIKFYQKESIVIR